MSGARVTGVFGKLASQGDFVTRRLPADFVRAWDRWLQEGMRASRAHLGADWLARYLEAPVWRFALAPRVCGQAAMTGVLLPGIDRVGRYFPLTLAAVTMPATCLAGLPAARVAWFDALADLGVAAMCGALSVADLELALDSLGPPPWDRGEPASDGATYWLASGVGMTPQVWRHAALPAAGRTGAMLVHGTSLQFAPDAN